MKRTLRALAALLAYPSEDLQAHAGELRAALARERALPASALERLEPLLRSLEVEELIDSQAAYSELFDRSRSLSLHMFEHVHGDSRDRGPALVDLGQQYAQRGYLMADDELPDFVPLFLEFLSCLSPKEAREWLGQPAHVFAALERRLDERGSPYAAVFGALVALPRAKPDRSAVAELTERMAAEDARTTDEAWEDAVVRFDTPVQDGCGPTGLIAKIRAARRAAKPATR